MKPNWAKIKAEYVSTQISYRQLCKKYNVSLGALNRRAQAERWAEQRRIQAVTIADKTIEKAAEIIADKQAKQIVDIKGIADDVLEQVLVAAQQLQTKTDKVTKKVRKYDKRTGETKEQVVLSEEMSAAPGTIDTKKAKEIMDCLKAYAEILAVVGGKPGAESDGVEIVFDI